MTKRDFSFLDDILKRRGVNPAKSPVRIDLNRVFGTSYAPESQLLRLTTSNKPIVDPTIEPPPKNLKMSNSGYWTENNLDKLYSKGTNMQEALERNNVKETPKANASAGGKLAKFGRIAGAVLNPANDYYDVRAGWDKIQNGRPFVGGAQLALGGVGLGLDALALASLFGTAGLDAPTVAGGMAVKQGLKQGAKALGKKAIQTAGKNFYNWGNKRMLGTAGIELFDLFTGYEDNEDKPEAKSTTEPPKKDPGFTEITDKEFYNSPQIQAPSGNMDDFVRGLVRDNGIGTEGNIPQGGLPNRDILDVYNRLLGVEPQVQEDVIQNIQPEATESPVDESLVLDRLNNIYDIKQSNLKPYIDALKDYYNDYRDLNKLGMLSDAFNAGYAGWSGNDAYKQMIGKYNPADIEAKRLDILAKLADIQTEAQLGREKLLANAELAKELGLSPSALLADSGLTKNLSNVAVAKLNNEARKEVARMNNVARLYGYDTGYSGKVDVAGINARAKLIDSLLDSETDKAIAQGKLDLAMKLQKAKDRNKLQATYMQQLPWVTDASQLNAVMKQFGIDLGDIPTTTNTVAGGNLGGISSYSNSARDAINRYDAGKQ